MTLWYLLLGKKSLLVAMYKADPFSERIYKFLRNDFSSAEYQVKAQKNAFGFRQKREFMMSAAMFLLGGRLQDAVDVILHDLGDPQLALVAARLLEGEGEVYLGVIRKFFIPAAAEANDPWLLSISHTLLGEHAESLICLRNCAGKQLKQPNNWKQGTSPYLKGFHPCILTFARLLKRKFYVKRELENRGVALDSLADTERPLALRGAAILLRAGLPSLALQLMHQYKVHDETTMLQEILTIYIHSVMLDTSEKEWKNKFTSLVSEIEFIHSHFGVPRALFLNYVANIFYKQDLRHYECALWAAYGRLDKCIEVALDKACPLHILVSKLSRELNFIYTLDSIKSVIKDLSLCLSIIHSEFQGTESPHFYQLSMSVYLGYFSLCYSKGNWNQLTDIITVIQHFLTYPDSEVVEIHLADLVHTDNKLFTTWLRYLAVAKLLALLSSVDFGEIDDPLDASLLNSRLVESPLEPGRGLRKRPLMTMSRLVRRLNSWKRRLLLRAQ